MLEGRPRIANMYRGDVRIEHGGLGEKRDALVKEL